MKRFLLVCLFFGATAVMLGQELNAVVTVNYQNLPVQNKESLGRFAEDVQNYLNSTKFTGQEWKFQKISCNFNISITSAADEINYSGQAVIISQRGIFRSRDFSPMLRVMDNNWNFTYERNQTFYPNQLLFNSLLSFFDYYALLIIGLEADSWDKLAGTPYFMKANDIVNLASSNSASKGWIPSAGSYNRRDMIDNLLSEKFRIVREGMYDYHYAIDLMAQRSNNPQKYEANQTKGREKIAALIRTIEGIKSKIDVSSFYIKALFDAKHLEIIEKLKSYPDKEIFRVLKSVDPPHIGKYDEVYRN